MEYFEKVFNQLLAIKNSHYNLDNMKSEIATIMGHELHDKYLMLTPTERNQEIAKAIKNLYPNVYVYVDILKTQTTKTSSISDLICKELQRKEPHIHNLIGLLKQNIIIIEKTLEVIQYLDSLKLYSKLVGKRYTAPAKARNGNKYSFFGNLNHFIYVNYLPATIENYDFNIRNHIPYHTFKVIIPIEGSDFLKLDDPKKRKNYRDHLLEKAFNEVQQFLPFGYNFKKTSYSFYITSKLFNRLSSYERNKLARFNARSSGFSSQVKNDDSYFVAYISCESTISDIREFMMNKLKKS